MLLLTHFYLFICVYWYRQTGWLGTCGVNRDRVLLPRGIEITVLFHLKSFNQPIHWNPKLKETFQLYHSWLWNSVSIHPTFPEPPRLTVVKLKYCWFLEYCLCLSVCLSVCLVTRHLRHFAPHYHKLLHPQIGSAVNHDEKIWKQPFLPQQSYLYTIWYV